MMWKKKENVEIHSPTSLNTNMDSHDLLGSGKAMLTPFTAEVSTCYAHKKDQITDTNNWETLVIVLFPSHSIYKNDQDYCFHSSS